MGEQTGERGFAIFLLMGSGVTDPGYNGSGGADPGYKGAGGADPGYNGENRWRKYLECLSR